MKEIRRLNREDLADEVLTVLRDRPYLLVLDGFERLLTSYHRFAMLEVKGQHGGADD